MSRRAAIKTMLGAAAVVIAVPHMGSLNLLGKSAQEIQTKTSLGPLNTEDEPFVILVGKDELRGFKGETEYSLKDSAAVQQVMGAFSNAEPV